MPNAQLRRLGSFLENMFYGYAHLSLNNLISKHISDNIVLQMKKLNTVIPKSPFIRWKKAKWQNW